jgi:hypothetical protein
VAKEVIVADFLSLSKFISRLSRSIALRLAAFFGSTYCCEEASSQMKIITSRYQSRLTDGHLKYCLHLCLRNYETSFSNLEIHQQIAQISNKVQISPLS